MLFSVQLVEAFGFMFFSFIHETLDFLLESFADTTSTPKKKKKKQMNTSMRHPIIACTRQLLAMMTSALILLVSSLVRFVACRLSMAR
jgi:hypothetical protein